MVKAEITRMCIMIWLVAVFGLIVWNLLKFFGF